MNRFCAAAALLSLSFSADAALDHWTCSNDTTVMFLALDTDDGNFVLWDDGGQFLAAAKFTDSSKTASGVPFFIATLDNGIGVGVAKSGDNLILAFTDAKGKAINRFLCN
jgi:hypothetical protein